MSNLCFDLFQSNTFWWWLFRKDKKMKDRWNINKFFACWDKIKIAFKPPILLVSFFFCSSGRRPGLMPDPTPSKIPRLGNVNYSWMKPKLTAPSDTTQQQPNFHGYIIYNKHILLNKSLNLSSPLSRIYTFIISINR